VQTNISAKHLASKLDFLVHMTGGPYPPGAPEFYPPSKEGTVCSVWLLDIQYTLFVNM